MGRFCLYSKILQMPMLNEHKFKINEIGISYLGSTKDTNSLTQTFGLIKFRSMHKWYHETYGSTNFITYCFHFRLNIIGKESWVVVI